MLSIELINLYNNMFALTNYCAILLVIPPVPILSILFVSITFNKYKNLVLETLGLKIGSYVLLIILSLFGFMISLLDPKKRSKNRYTK